MSDRTCAMLQFVLSSFPVHCRCTETATLCCTAIVAVVSGSQYIHLQQATIMRRCYSNLRSYSAYSVYLQVDEELGKLMALLPGLEFRFERMKADLVIKLLTQPQGVAARLVALRAALPAADIAAIATTVPSLLTDQTPEELVACVQDIRCTPATVSVTVTVSVTLVVPVSVVISASVTETVKAFVETQAHCTFCPCLFCNLKGKSRSESRFPCK